MLPLTELITKTDTITTMETGLSRRKSTIIPPLMELILVEMPIGKLMVRDTMIMMETGNPSITMTELLLRTMLITIKSRALTPTLMLLKVPPGRMMRN